MFEEEKSLPRQFLRGALKLPKPRKISFDLGKKKEEGGGSRGLFETKCQKSQFSGFCKSHKQSEVNSQSSQMGAFPLWIMHVSKFDSNLKYVGSKLERRVIDSEIGYSLICCVSF